jgi:8-oxo-dGTP diphosphatase
LLREKKECIWEANGNFREARFEAGETPEECLQRELKEESFRIEFIVRDFFGESVYDYGGNKKIRLIGYSAKYISGDFQLTELIAHKDAKWVYPSELSNYDFAEADLPFVKKLINL